MPEGPTLSDAATLPHPARASRRPPRSVRSSCSARTSSACPPCLKSSSRATAASRQRLLPAPPRPVRRVLCSTLLPCSACVSAARRQLQPKYPQCALHPLHRPLGSPCAHSQVARVTGHAHACVSTIRTHSYPVPEHAAAHGSALAYSTHRCPQCDEPRAACHARPSTFVVRAGRKLSQAAWSRKAPPTDARRRSLRADSAGPQRLLCTL